jgi:hypothetical protein
MPRPRQENRVRRRGVSCCLSAAGIRFLGILSRPGIPPLLRSAYRTATISGADPSGFSMFRTRETRPGPGVLCTPGTAVPAWTRMHPVSAACRLAATGPCHPGTAARPGMFFSRGISKGSLAFAPPGLPLACDPRTDRGPWALPRASHPAGQDPAAHAGAGTGLRHWPGVTSPPSTAASFLDAPTHYERHHVAMHSEERSSPGDGNVWLPRNLPGPGRSSSLNPQACMRTTPLGPAPARCATETPATRREAAKPQLTTVQKSAVPQFATHAECRRLAGQAAPRSTRQLPARRRG